jgi:hypothetical protein
MFSLPLIRGDAWYATYPRETSHWPFVNHSCLSSCSLPTTPREVAHTLDFDPDSYTNMFIVLNELLKSSTFNDVAEPADPSGCLRYGIALKLRNLRGQLEPGTTIKWR